MLVLTSVPTLAAADVRACIAAWGGGEYIKAISIWRPLADGGNADAQFNLAQAYKLGRGVPVNLAAAQGYYERAARQGHRDAQTSLGLTMFGNGDQIGAMRWLKLAADSGEPRAMLIFGTALFNGDGVASDRVRAFAMISRAAALGLKDADAILAEMNQIMPVAERRRGIAMALQMAGRPSVTKAAKEAPSAGKVAAKSAASVPAATTVSGPWRVQLGAFAQKSTAEALYRRLSAGGSMTGRQPILTAVGAVTRLQVGPYPTRAAAVVACAALQGQPCFPVR
jgi:hypothetical protein